MSINRAVATKDRPTSFPFMMKATGQSLGTKSRKRLVGTDQQEAFWSAMVGGESHVLLEARAGCGKSTSAREAMHRLLECDSRLRLTYVAFNRAIADEFQVGLPLGAKASTMHSLGYAAIRASIPNVGSPAPHKMRNIVDAMLPRRDRKTQRIKTAIIKLAELCKSHLIDGENSEDLEHLAASHGIDLREGRATAFGLVPTVLTRCLKQPSIVCFSDMVWLPVMLGLDFPACDVLFIDEAQDLDPCQHALVTQATGDGRMVVIGDPFQAIYGFRGADTRSMSTLGRQLEHTPRGLERFPLTQTRRCPARHVELAARIVPDFEAMPEAPKGEIYEDVPLDVLQPGVMALCRTNAPLIAVALNLAQSGVPVAVQGRDIGRGLARLIESFDAPNTATLVRRIHDYRVSEIGRLAEIEGSEPLIESIQDRCECLLAIAHVSDTPDEAVRLISDLFLEATPQTQERCVLFSSIHRAKGREADEVAILSPDLMPHRMAKTPEAREQEFNLAYVAATRSKWSLSFCGPIPSLFS